jgi:hypothetical protein
VSEAEGEATVKYGEEPVEFEFGVQLEGGRWELAPELYDIDAGESTYFDADNHLLFEGVTFPTVLEAETEGAED